MNQDAKNKKSNISEIALIITAIAALITAIFGSVGLWNWFADTPTPEANVTQVAASQTSNATSQILFFEDFQDRQQAFYSLDGYWSIQEDPYQAGNQIFQVDTTGTTAVSNATLVQDVSEPYVIEFRTRFTQGDLANRGFVSIGWLDNYNFVIFPAIGKVYARNRDTLDEFFSHDFVFEVNVWYTLRAAINENTAIFFLDGQIIGSIEDIPPVISHDLNFVIGEESGIVQFDDFYVTKTGQ